MLARVRSALVLRKMPAPKKRKDGPKQAKKAPPKPKMTMLEVKRKYFNALPPLPRYEYPDERCFVKQLKRPKHPLSNEEIERRALLDKDYSRYMNNYWYGQQTKLRAQLACRTKALEHLESVSPLLYKSAITFDYTILPFQWKGPKESPAKEEHKAPVRRKEVKECNEEAVKSTMINEIEAKKAEIELRKFQKGSKPKKGPLSSVGVSL